MASATVLAVRLRPVQDRHAGAALGQRLRGRLSEAGRPADDDGLLPRDLHLAPFPKSARFVKQPSRRHFSVRLSGGRIGTLACMATSGTRALAGVAAAAVALGVTQLVAAFVGPQRRFPHRGRVDGHRPHAGPGQGMGDSDVRHGRQTLPDDRGAGGDRRHRRGRRAMGDAPRSRSAARRSCWPGSPDARRCCPARARRSSTSCPPSIGTVCGVAVLRLLTSGRFTDGADEPDEADEADRRPDPRSAAVADDARDFSPRARVAGVGGRRAVPAEDVGRR